MPLDWLFIRINLIITGLACLAAQIELKLSMLL